MTAKTKTDGKRTHTNTNYVDPDNSNIPAQRRENDLLATLKAGQPSDSPLTMTMSDVRDMFVGQLQMKLVCAKSRIESQIASLTAECVSIGAEIEAAANAVVAAYVFTPSMLLLCSVINEQQKEEYKWVFEGTIKPNRYADDGNKRSKPQVVLSTQTIHGACRLMRVSTKNGEVDTSDTFDMFQHTVVMPFTKKLNTLTDRSYALDNVLRHANEQLAAVQQEYTKIHEHKQRFNVSVMHAHLQGELKTKADLLRVIACEVDKVKFAPEIAAILEAEKQNNVKHLENKT